MFLRSLGVIDSVWLHAVLGTGLLIVGTVVGWAITPSASFPPVRLIRWWVRRVALPLLRCRSWSRRSAAIFANNILVLVVLTVSGRWHTAAVLAVAGLGVSLGVGLKTLAVEPITWRAAEPDSAPDRRRTIRIGLALNCLEPLAIMLTIGLCLGRASVPLEPVRVWETFGLWAVPLSLLAAGGEALWIGASLASPPTHEAEHIEPTEPPFDS